MTHRPPSRDPGDDDAPRIETGDDGVAATMPIDAEALIPPDEPDAAGEAGAATSEAAEPDELIEADELIEVVEIIEPDSVVIVDAVIEADDAASESPSDTAADAVAVIDAAPDEAAPDEAALVEAGRAPDEDAATSGSTAIPVVDLVFGAAATGVGATVAVVRGARRVGRASRPVARVMLRPPLVPSSLQPGSWLEAGARRTAEQRDRAQAELARRLDAALDAVVPVVVDQIVRRIDLTSLVVRQVDFNVVVQSVDLTGLAEQVMERIDLPEIIRESTGSVASETVRGARMQGIAADEAISRAVDRLLFRRPRPAP